MSVYHSKISLILINVFIKYPVSSTDNIFWMIKTQWLCDILRIKQMSKNHNNIVNIEYAVFITQRHKYLLRLTTHIIQLQRIRVREYMHWCRNNSHLNVYDKMLLKFYEIYTFTEQQTKVWYTLRISKWD